MQPWRDSNAQPSSAPIFICAPLPRRLSRGFWRLVFILALAAPHAGLAQVVPPVIVVDPEDLVVKTAQAATFSVVAIGTEPFAYQWRRNGTNLAGETDYFLAIAETSTNHAGSYSVRVSNSAGAVTSAVARLTVVPASPGSLDVGFGVGVGADSVVRVAVPLDNGKILIGGYFYSVHGVVRRSIARLNSDGSLDESFTTGSGPDGPVFDIAVQSDERIIIAGQFNQVNGISRPRVARLKSDGTLDLSFNQTNLLNGTAWSVVLQPPSSPLALEVPQRVIVGGDFILASDVSTSSLIRLEVNGRLDPTFAVSLTGQVRTMELDGEGRLLVGGGYLQVTNSSTRALFRLFGDGGIDPGFAHSFSPGAYVFSVSPQPDNAIVVGGSFYQVSGSPRNNIARLTSSGLLDSNFNPGAGANSSVATTALQPDGKIVIGGGFTSVSGVPRNRLARLLTNGLPDLGFESEPGPNDWVESVAVQPDGRIIAVGSFTSVDGVWRGRLARLSGGDPSPFAPVIMEEPVNRVVFEGSDAKFSVSALAYPAPSYQWQFGSSIMTGATQRNLTLRNLRQSSAGSYRVSVSNAHGAITSRVASLTVNAVPLRPGGPDIAFYPGLGPDRRVTSVAVQGDDRILIGGYFTNVDGVVRRGVARLLNDGALDTSFDPGFVIGSGWVNTLALQTNGQILVGGAFYSASNAVATHALTRLNPNGSQDTSFGVSGLSYGTVYAVAPLAGGSVLAGGSLAIPYWPYQLGLAHFNAFGQLQTNFLCRLNSSGVVYAFAVQPGGKIVLGGDFNEVNGTFRKGMARVQTNGALDLSFDVRAGADTPVRAMALQADGRVLIAGNFTRFGGWPARRVARLNPDGSLDHSFESGLGPNYSVNALSLRSDGRILVGGTFTGVSGKGGSGIARLNSDGSLDVTFDASPGANAEVRAVGVQSNGTVIVAGDFTEIAGVTRTRVARLRAGDPPNSAPVIVAGPQSQVVPAGGDAYFSVFTKGQPLPGYQWQLDSRDLAGADRWFLRLPNVRMTDSGIYSVDVSNSLGSVVSSMAFLSVAPPALSAGAPDIDFYTGLGPSDPVTAVAVQRDRRLLIAGAFTEVNGAVVPHLARLLPDGRVDTSFTPALGFTDTIRTILLQPNGRILAAGNLLNSPTNSKPVVRLLSDGRLDSSFNAPVGLRGEAFALALQSDGKILVGGSLYTNYGPAQYVVRLNIDGSLDPSFRFAGTIYYGVVKCIAVQADGRIVIGGGFLASPSVGSGQIMRVFADGSLDTSFALNSYPPNGSVNSLVAESEGTMLIGGDFSYVGGLLRSSVARLRSDGSVDPSFDPPVMHNRVVNVLATHGDGKVLIAGGFRSINNLPFNRLARLNKDGSLDLTFDPGLGATDGSSYLDDYDNYIDGTEVLAMAVDSDGKVVVGGNFGRMDGIPRSNLARVFGHDPSARIETRAVLLPGGAMIELRWEAGTLQRCLDLGGDWEDVPGATSPFLISPSTVQTFYRLRFN